MVAADDAMLRSMAHGASPPAQPSPLRQAGDASRARRQRVRPRSSNLAACARVAFNLLLIPLLEPPASPHGTMRRRRRRRRSSGGGESKRACLEGNTHAQLHGGTPCAIGCPRSSCRTPSKSVRPRRMAPCEGGRRRRSSGGLPAAFARRTARQWRDTWCQRMHNCTEAHPAPLVALEAPVDLPQRASALASRRSDRRRESFAPLPLCSRPEIETAPAFLAGSRELHVGSCHTPE